MGDAKKIFKQNLSRYIKKSEMTQVELAKKLGVSKANITNWLNGASMPDIDIINSICVILNVKMSVMLGEEEVFDEKKEQLIRNYELLNSEAQETLVDFSEMLVSKPRNLKNKAPPGTEKAANE